MPHYHLFGVVLSGLSITAEETKGGGPGIIERRIEQQGKGK
jgi:hypothetical protein